MNLRIGITAKFLGWYSVFFLIYFGTVLVLYINVHRMMKISEIIIQKHDKISSAARTMFENLLNMEENEKKYALLKKEEYRNYFIRACREFETGLSEILEIDSQGMNITYQWKELEQRYRKYDLRPESLIQSGTELWIPEEELDAWRKIVAQARTQNEKDMELANLELNRRGAFTVQSGMAGLGLSVLIGLFGGIILAHSMIRPLRELIKGIRSVSHDRPGDLIPVSSKDEFGELATAYNDMAFRLKEEQGMRTDFISMLSHEIRTPLTSIRESVSLIGEGLMGSINERQGKFLQIADTEIGRVCELLNRILQVSYLESGAPDMQKQTVSPASIISQCMEQNRGAAEGKGILLVFQDISHTPDVIGDIKYLQQVFTNLIGNAIKFSPSGTTVSIRTETEPNRSGLRFLVSDNGPGIPEDEIPFIFNRYYRAKGTRDRTDGTGLGLSIARHIIEAHGGSIQVSSTEGKGTTFVFSLPIAR